MNTENKTIENIDYNPSSTEIHKVACCNLKISVDCDKSTGKPIRVNAVSLGPGGCHSNHAFISQLLTILLEKGHYDELSKLEAHTCSACMGARKKLTPDERKKFFRSCGDAIVYRIQSYKKRILDSNEKK